MNLTRLPALLDAEIVAATLAADAVVCRVREKGHVLTPGQAVGVRLNLNVLKSTGLAIQTVHEGRPGGQSFFRGEAVEYAQAVHLNNAVFAVSQTAREAIATGQQNKHPMASVDGTLVALTSPDDFEGLPVRFNPRSGHLFVDAEGFAVAHADEVIVMGHRAYARGKVTYHTEATAPKQVGIAPTDVRFKPWGEHERLVGQAAQADIPPRRPAMA